MISFEESYKSILGILGSNLSTNEVVNYIDKVQEAINNVKPLMKSYAFEKKNIEYIKGDIAEGWHEGTFNVSAISKDKSNTFAISLKDTSPIDIVAISPHEIISAQLKYFRNAEDTAKAISNPKYFSLLKVVPQEQLNGVKSAAYKLYLKNINSRPNQAQQYFHTYKIAIDHLRLNTLQSLPLSEAEAKQIAKELINDTFSLKKHNLTTESFINWSDIARVSGKAALNSALITASLRAAPYIFIFLKNYIVNNKIDLNEIEKSGTEFFYGIRSGALIGGIASAITASCNSGLLGETLKNINPNIIAGATIVAINSVINSLKLYKGEITQSEYIDNCLRDSIAVCLGIWGASFGQACIPIPILGALIGSLIGSTLGILIYEGSRELLISFAVKYNISFFTIFKQDYTIPLNVISDSGLKMISLDFFKPNYFILNKYNLNTFKPISFDFKALHRGLIKMNVVGYIQK